MELEVTSLTKNFQDTIAVNNISINMKNGVYGLLGANGAGKTTFMRMLCTLLNPSEGEITWDGQNIFGMEGEYRKILGYLPQDFGYYPDFSVWDYLMYIASIKGLRPMVAKKRSEKVLKQVGLEKYKNKKMKKLSGGMKRRAGIAQAILNNPQILILDEPTAGLDPKERIRFRCLISELSEDRIVLLSTHIVSDVEYIANQILLMKEGNIIISGSTEEVIASMKAQVWSITVSKKEIENYLHSFQVSNMKTTEEDSELRIISNEKPSETAKIEQATLEDAFLYYFGEKAGEEDDEI